MDTDTYIVVNTHVFQFDSCESVAVSQISLLCWVKARTPRRLRWWGLNCHTSPVDRPLPPLVSAIIYANQKAVVICSYLVTLTKKLMKREVKLIYVYILHFYSDIFIIMGPSERWGNGNKKVNLIDLSTVWWNIFKFPNTDLNFASVLITAVHLSYSFALAEMTS